MLWPWPQPVIGTAAAPCGNFRIKFPSHFLGEAVSSLLILFPSAYFYLVFHLTTQLKQPPVFFLFLQSIRNKWGDIFSPPYTDKNSIVLWSRFEMLLTEFQSLRWDLASKVNVQCKDGYGPKLSVKINYSPSIQCTMSPFPSRTRAASVAGSVLLGAGWNSSRVYRCHGDGSEHPSRKPMVGHEPLPRWLEGERLSLWLAQEARITGLYHKMLKRKWQFSIKIPSDSFQFLP